MLKIGITGGIGSGKTTVSEIFKLLNVPVFNADVIARKLQESDSEIRNRLSELFGSEIFQSDGKLNRKKLASIIFNNSDILQVVNSIIHPAVHNEYEKWLKNFNKNDYILYESALLFETGYYKNFDYTILIVADESVRMERILKRDKTERSLVQERMNNQLNDSKKIMLADYIIENNDTDLITSTIITLDKKFKEVNNDR